MGERGVVAGGSMARPPLVFDLGSGNVKVGYAGNDAPRCVMPNIIGRPTRQPRLDLGELEFYVGHAAITGGGGNHNITSPVTRGLVNNWQDMEKVWHHVFYRELTVIPEETPMLMLDSPAANPKDREEMVSILFENFAVPAFYSMMQAVAAMIGSARTYGVVLDSGHGVTHAVPVYEGAALQHGIVAHQMAGQDIEGVLSQLIQNNGTSDVPHSAVAEMKEKLCFVPLDYDKEIAAADIEPATYNLPDGRNITLTDERFAAVECLFNPSVCDMYNVEPLSSSTGVHDVVGESLYCIDQEVRKKLWNTLVLAGGTTLTTGYVERLERDIPSVLPHGCNMQVVAPDPRKYAPWMGGSIAASTEAFQSQMWIHLNEYNEYGPSIFHRRCY